MDRPRRKLRTSRQAEPHRLQRRLLQRAYQCLLDGPAVPQARLRVEMTGRLKAAGAGP